MRVLVTGGAGFIGHHLVGRLLESGHQVSVLDNLSRGCAERVSRAAFFSGDIREQADCARAVASCDAVVHLAAQSNVMGSQSDPGRTFETNVTGTWNIARAAAEAGVKHLVFASSREVYGEPATLPVHENAPFAPRNLYGASKVAGEVLLSTLPVGGPVVSILRLGNVIGSGDSGRVVPLWLNAARRGEALTLFGGQQVLDFVPVDLVCEAFTVAIEHGPLSRPVNVASGRGVTLVELAGRIQSLFAEMPPAVEVLPAREVEVTRFTADVGRMRSDLCIEPPVDSLAILASMAAAE